MGRNFHNSLSGGNCTGREVASKNLPVIAREGPDDKVWGGNINFHRGQKAPSFGQK